ncbi:hypothetical protein L5515_014047 [Caenorhabditis briggsae]|uniref:Edg1 TPR repeats region domain-containing protein n=1 Tax=Caenorhabditis briggsae TaxID=6238 RepID=A0AAE9EE92_CAEBR|nr:hypothetical protein L5515_014047 [Caenorhabditis briggsae]
MNNPEESAVRDLGRFTVAVLNGHVDLESSAADLIRYNFGMRTVKDVIRRGSEDAELINQILDHIFHLVIYLNEEIIATSGKATSIGMENHHFIELRKRMHLMYEVWLGMQVNEAYTIRDVVQHVDASKEAIMHTYNKCKEFHRWKELPPALREFFLDEKEEVAPPVEEPEPTMFAREDGVVSSIAHEKAQSEEEGKKKQFLAKTEKVLSNYRAKNPDYKTMRELINAKTKFRLEGIYCDNLINQFITVWDITIDHETVKPEEKYAFTGLLKKVFLMMVDKRRNDFATKLYDKYKQDADVLPCLENFIENFQSGLTEAINQLPLDSNVLSNNMELFEKTKDPIIWYLLVSPANAVQQLLTMCVDNKGYIPIIGRIFRGFPTLFYRCVNITPLPFEEPEKKDKLLITILHRIFMIGRTTWTSAAQWENAGMMTISLAKDRKRKEGQLERLEDKSLIDPFSLILFCLHELLKDYRKPTKSVEVFVKMLQRLLANNNNNRMLTNYRFGTSFSNNEENVLPTPIIMQLMFELLVEYDGQSIEVCESAREVLKSIAGRMDNDKAVFDRDVCFFLISENFNQAPWWVKYSLFTWFSNALGKPRRQVPSGIYKTIPEHHLDEFEQIKSEESCAVPECFMRSIFELGLFDVDLAVDLVKYGYGVKFEGSVVEKMALALVDSYGKKMSKRNGGLEMGTLITAILNTFDPIRELAPLNSYCTSYLKSLKKVEHLLILFMAARIAREKQLCAARIRKDDVNVLNKDELLSLNAVSEQIMDIFCETTKAHIEKEVSEVEKIRRDAESFIFSPGFTPEQCKALVEREEREQSLILQLTMIYLKCGHFCRLYQQVPMKLQQLMNSTLEKQFDSQKLLAKRVMDDVLTDQRKTEVVYAFVEQKDVVVERKSPEKESVQPVKPSELYKQQTQPIENVSAENAMFFINNGEYRHARGGYTSNRGNNRRPNFENDRPSSSRVNSRSDRRDSFRGNIWPPVDDVQTFVPRDRDFVHKHSKIQSTNDFDRGFPRNDQSRHQYDPEKLYLDDRRTPYSSHGAKTSDYDDTENDRMLQQTIQSVRNYNYREQQNQYTSRPGTSNPTSSKGPEGKPQQPKKGFGSEYNNRFNGNSRKQNERKPRYVSSNYHDQEDEITNRMKPGQPEREELAHALGLNNRDPDPPQRRGGFGFR